MCEAPPGIRFLRPELWHITVFFLGYQDDGDLPLITEVIDEAAKNFFSPEIVLDKIIYDSLHRPRMIWAVTDQKTSESLGLIREDLEQKLIDGGLSLKNNGKKFQGHITLARFSRGNFGQKLGEINLKSRDIDAYFPETIDLMESQLSPRGAKYSVLGRSKFRE